MFRNTRKPLLFHSLSQAQTAFLFFLEPTLTCITQLLTNQNFNAPILSDNFSPFTAFAG